MKKGIIFLLIVILATLFYLSPADEVYCDEELHLAYDKYIEELSWDERAKILNDIAIYFEEKDGTQELKCFVAYFYFLKNKE